MSPFNRIDGFTNYLPWVLIKNRRCSVLNLVPLDLHALGASILQHFLSWSKIIFVMNGNRIFFTYSLTLQVLHPEIIVFFTNLKALQFWFSSCTYIHLLLNSRKYLGSEYISKFHHLSDFYSVDSSATSAMYVCRVWNEQGRWTGR